MVGFLRGITGVGGDLADEFGKGWCVVLGEVKGEGVRGRDHCGC